MAFSLWVISSFHVTRATKSKILDQDFEVRKEGTNIVGVAVLSQKGVDYSLESTCAVTAT
jgi:hypothetical protein